MPREGGNPAGRRPSSRNAKPYDVNNVSSIVATTGDRRDVSERARDDASFRAALRATRVARRSGRRRAPTPRRMVSRMPALSLRGSPPRAISHGVHGYVSEPDDNLNLRPVFRPSRAGPSRDGHVLNRRSATRETELCSFA